MNRMKLRAVVFVSVLTMLVFGINLVVGAQEPSKPAEKPAQTQMEKGKSKTMTTQAAGTLSASDKKFIMDAAHGGMKEVDFGKLGVEKAASDDVKQYAQRLIDDHSKANDELMQLASQKGVTIQHDMATDTAMKQTSATDPAAKSKDMASAHGSAADKEHHGLMSKLSGLSGNEFDKEFIRAAVKDHEKDVKEFEKQSTKATDPDVRAFAAGKVPTLREHLQMARDLDKKLSAKR